ncbi:MAG: glycosyltransferase [Gemmatimonadota bacterium]
MKLCYVVDGRSPIARNWMAHFVAAGHEVHLISTYPGADATGFASTTVIPVAFARLAGAPGRPAAPGPAAGERAPASRSAPLAARWRGGALAAAANALRYGVGPLDVFRWRGRLRRRLLRIQPDLVHAMRLPFEGLLAADAVAGTTLPLLLSVWGNDFTLFARRHRLVRWRTRAALRRADGLHADCQRDIELARAFGWPPGRPAIVLPGAGGVQRELFHPGPADPALRARLGIPDGAPLFLNPRGLRLYVRNDTFFQAIPRVLSRRPDAVFLGLAMAGNAIAEGWVDRLGIGPSVRLLPPVPRAEMAAYFRLATAVVSPSEHDGTPNTLLEAMACGTLPILGDIASVREWITDDHNGLLFDPADPDALAEAIGRSLTDCGLHQRAARANAVLIQQRADHATVMPRAEAFYFEVIAAARGRGRP